jgi:hypothetical protein
VEIIDFPPALINGGDRVFFFSGTFATGSCFTVVEAAAVAVVKALVRVDLRPQES